MLLDLVHNNNSGAELIAEICFIEVERRTRTKNLMTIQTYLLVDDIRKFFHHAFEISL